MNSATLKMANDGYAVNIGTQACQALLEEVYTTPKPGLVDLYSSGAHKDMDVDTFEQSARVLRPYFVRMAQQGFTDEGYPEELFCRIRKTGIAAERAMYRVTNGVNTHKGAVFTLGIYCAAAGRCLSEDGIISGRRLRDIQVLMTEDILKKEMLSLGKKPVLSHGEKNYRDYGTTGVRGEALQGYPVLWDIALPVFCQGIKEGRIYNCIKLQTLLTLMCYTEDSNVIARHNPEILQKMKKDAGKLLKNGGAYGQQSFRKLMEMDREYTAVGISPGGCADLLAAVIFLKKMLGQRIE